jgi:hypothetical protein
MVRMKNDTSDHPFTDALDHGYARQQKTERAGIYIGTIIGAIVAFATGKKGWGFADTVFNGTFLGWIGASLSTSLFGGNNVRSQAARLDIEHAKLKHENDALKSGMVELKQEAERGTQFIEKLAEQRIKSSDPTLPPLG